MSFSLMETAETVTSLCRSIQVEGHVWCWNLQHMGRVFNSQSWYVTWLAEVHHRKSFAHIHGGKRNNYPLCAFGTFFWEQHCAGNGYARRSKWSSQVLPLSWQHDQVATWIYTRIPGEWRRVGQMLGTRVTWLDSSRKVEDLRLTWLTLMKDLTWHS